MARVEQLFPINIFMDMCNLDIEGDIAFLEKMPLADSPVLKSGQSNDEAINNYGYRSQSFYVLNNPEVATLRNWIVDCLDEYAIKVLGYDISGMGITQSWVSIKDTAQRHLAHTHPNSLISGVFYFDDSETPITFTEEDKDFLMVKRNPEIAPYNQYHVHPMKYGVILFPSWLEHEVTVNNDVKRSSLSFNSVPLEGFGSAGDLTEIRYDMIQGRMQ